jgi:hypothetical protein
MIPFGGASNRLRDCVRAAIGITGKTVSQTADVLIGAVCLGKPYRREVD